MSETTASTTPAIQQWCDEYRGRSLMGHFGPRDFVRALDALQAVIDLCDSAADREDADDPIGVDEVRAVIAGALNV